MCNLSDAVVRTGYFFQPWETAIPKGTRISASFAPITPAPAPAQQARTWKQCQQFHESCFRIAHHEVVWELKCCFLLQKFPHQSHHAGKIGIVACYAHARSCAFLRFGCAWQQTNSVLTSPPSEFVFSLRQTVLHPWLKFHLFPRWGGLDGDTCLCDPFDRQTPVSTSRQPAMREGKTSRQPSSTSHGPLV